MNHGRHGAAGKSGKAEKFHQHRLAISKFNGSWIAGLEIITARSSHRRGSFWRGFTALWLVCRQSRFGCGCGRLHNCGWIATGWRLRSGWNICRGWSTSRHEQRQHNQETKHPDLHLLSFFRIKFYYFISILSSLLISHPGLQVNVAVYYDIHGYNWPNFDRKTSQFKPRLSRRQHE
jgi:hypothetical protein